MDTAVKLNVSKPLLAATLIVFTLAVHVDALRGWWTEDDPQILLQLMREDTVDTLFDPERWRNYSASNFAPLVVLSYNVDYALFGLEPFWFYLHHLVSLALAIAVLFGLTCSFARRWIAFAAAAAVVVSPAGVYAARTLMVRHYIEGMLFAVLAVWSWSARKRWSGWAAAALYFFAALAKEVYAPLLLVFIAESILRRESVRFGIRRLVPSALAALLYAVWRAVMLGSIGGYETELSIGSIALLPFRLWPQIRGLSGWLPGLVWLAAILFGFAGIIRLQDFWRFLLAAALMALFVFLPLVSVAPSLATRLVIVPTAVLAVLTAIAAEKSGRWRTGLWVPIAFLVGAGLSGWQESQWLARDYQRMRAEGRYVWTEPPTGRPLLASSSVWYLDGLRMLRVTTQNGESPTVYASMYGVLLEQQRPELLVEPDSAGRIVPISPQTERNLQSLSARFQPVDPLHITLARVGNTLRWSLRPPGKEWLYMTVPFYKALRIEERVAYRFPGEINPPSMFFDPPVKFRIVRRTDYGWTVTPELTLPGSGQFRVWEGRGERAGQTSSGDTQL